MYRKRDKKVSVEDVSVRPRRWIGLLEDNEPNKVYKTSLCVTLPSFFVLNGGLVQLLLPFTNFQLQLTG